MGGRPGLKRRYSRRKCLWPIENYMFLSDETEKNTSVRTLLSGENSSNCLSIRATNCLLFLEEMTGTFYENNTNHTNTLCKSTELSNVTAGGSLPARTHAFKD